MVQVYLFIVWADPVYHTYNHNHVTSYTSWCRSKEVMPGKLSDDGYLSDKNWALNEERYKHAYIDINFANCIV